MSDKTLEQRIMAAVADYGEWCAARHSGMDLSKERRLMVDHIATLVAEACSPPPERVCLWSYWHLGGPWKRGCGGLGLSAVASFGTYCYACGGLIELSARVDQGIEE